MTQIRVDIDLDEIDDEDLMQEVRQRIGRWTAGDLSALFAGITVDVGRKGLELLKAEGLPAEMLQPIEGWLRQDAITRDHLASYLASVGADNAEKVD